MVLTNVTQIILTKEELKIIRYNSVKINKIEGKIIDECRGTNGFGYDPVFVPDGYDATFAQLPAEVKNSISHRARATGKFIQFINNMDNK